MAVHRVAVRILGSAFVAEFTDASAAHAVRRLWQPFVDSEAALSAQAVPVGDGSAPEQISRFAVGVNAAALDAAAAFAVHAGVVASSHGAIAMPATSGTGKSTLTAACLRRGFDYVSDEALCLAYPGDPSEPSGPGGEVRPYPRPLALSAWSARAIAQGLEGAYGVQAGDEWLFTAADLGSAVAREPLRLGHVVVLDRRPDDGAAPGSLAKPELEPLPRPEAVTLLLRLSFNHYRRPSDAVQLAAQVISGAAAWRLRYADPHDAADLLWSALG